MGGVPFSVDVIPHWNTIETWQLLADKLKGRRVKTKFLRRTLKKAHLVNRKHSKDEVMNDLNLCWKKCNLRKKHAKTFRPMWIEKKAAAHERAQNHVHTKSARQPNYVADIPLNQSSTVHSPPLTYF